MRGRPSPTASLVAALLAVALPAVAALPEEGILTVDRYTSEKGRALAVAHAGALLELSTGIYHCLPWVEVRKESIGFFKPRHLSADDRYLSIRIYIDQDPSPGFAKLPLPDRASSMFSRYVGPVLRRMAQSAALQADPAVDGFSIILEWLKQTGGRGGGRAVNETIAIFIDQPTAKDYVAGRIRVQDLAHRVRVLGWDGETALGSLRVSGWDDNFVSTFKVKGYVPQQGVSCQ